MYDAYGEEGLKGPSSDVSFLHSALSCFFSHLFLFFLFSLAGGGFRPTDAASIFEQFFGPGFSFFGSGFGFDSRRSAPQRGEDIVYKVRFFASALASWKNELLSFDVV